MWLIQVQADDTYTKFVSRLKVTKCRDAVVDSTYVKRIAGHADYDSTYV
jgi:hypothetical protein